MKTTIQISVFILLMTSVVNLSSAEDLNPPFAATCKDVVTHSYRDGTDLMGQSLGEEWSTDEHFNSTWKFVYPGGKYVLIDGKKSFVVGQHQGVLITVTFPKPGGFSSGVWSYAIHLGMKKVVASQVNAFGNFEPMMQGVKARSTNLTCKFALHTNQPPSFTSDFNEIIKQAQKRLQVFQFYTGPIDGEMSEETKASLRIFQMAEGIPATGELNGETRKALGIE